MRLAPWFFVRVVGRCVVWCLVGWILTAQGVAAGTTRISGVVQDDRGPVADAVVRIQATAHAARTDATGRFELEVAVEPPGGGAWPLTAWAPGRFCGGPIEVGPDSEDVTIHLERHTESDHAGYRWRTSLHEVGAGEDQGCATCHSREGTELGFDLPVDQWLRDAHGRSARNERFLTMYLGSDVEGNRSPPTRRVFVRDYGEQTLPPDPGLPYYGPGYKLDFPETAGSCAACHTPAAAVAAPLDTDPSGLSGVEAEGTPCDFCHKVWAVRLDTTTGRPVPNAPGVLSIELRRPPPGEQLFLGPYDDVAPGEDAYSSLQRESAYCAPCHFGVFWDTVVYDSYGEWLDSPYSDPANGRTCQDCHMPRTGATHFARPDKGGLERDPSTIFGHAMPGADDAALLRGAVNMEVGAKREKETVAVTVAITNHATGHHVPTDSPLRHLLLLVEAVDAEGRPLIQQAGPVVPAWGGVGDRAAGNYAGLPGKAFAKVLREVWTGIAPTGAYWNPTTVVSDNRLAAFATDESRYVFAAPRTGSVVVQVRLLFRRAFIELARQKGWPVKDQVMAQERFEVRPLDP